MIKFDEDEQNKKIAKLHELEEEQLAQVIADKYGYGYTDLTISAINTDALRAISEPEAREAMMAAFEVLGRTLSVAVISPENPKTEEVLDRLSKKFTLKIFLVSKKSLEYAWARYKDLSFAEATREGSLDISPERVAKFVEEKKTIADVQEAIKEVLSSKEGRQISYAVEIILAGALALDASDVHIEPEENEVRLRYRLDGLLTDVLKFEKGLYKYILSRIQLLSGLKLNVKDEAQDGRFSIQVGEADIEIRTSIIPGGYGDSVVLRVLNPESISVGIEELGIEPHLLKILRHELSKPNGMLLTTGPTGSGKTTALYAFLKEIHKPEIKIITIEDPIEYHLQGIVQTQVKKDYTFASGLRSVLRQDPDVVMVGEIRDSETAEIAINASLTGHLVFSTLHTNNAAGTFPRLVDLGVDPKVIAPAMNVAMAQRLVRKLCTACRKPKQPSSEEKMVIEKILENMTDKSLIPQEWQMFEAVGCEKCSSTGYRGRYGIFEIILVDETIESVVSGYSSEREIKEAAKVQGIPTMKQDGILKVIKGATTLEEVGRVVDLEDESE